MKKNDSVRVNKFVPKPQTIKFILDFSKSLSTLKSRKKVFVICKN